MGLTPRRLAAALVAIGVISIAVSLSLLFTPAAGLLAIGVGATALGLEELLR